ncbi:MAG TPA: guanylate kinase [Candidatus Saccharimonadales bacterium]|nr:guanylate kinase [Candidatus Saccharimonadales bacterium]
MKRGKLLIISGASAGVGKDTLVKLFLTKHPEWEKPASVVTRKPRPGEVNGVDYYFVGQSTFDKWVKNNDFLETDFHASHWYGTLRKPIEDLLSRGRDIILRKDVNGSLKIKQRIPGAILVYIDVESHDVLESRIRARSSETAETEEQIQERLKLAKKEQKFKEHFDYVIINAHNRPEEAVEAIEKAAGV